MANLQSARTRFLCALILIQGAAASCQWWYETTSHHGWSVRNASAFGAVGDGKTDDTEALRAAIDSNRGGDSGSGQDKSAAFIYLPNGTYLISDTLVLWKWTKILGNPLPGCTSTIMLAPNSPGFSGSDGLKPALVTNVGFNISASEHAWWIEDVDVGGNTNMLFFSAIQHVSIVIGAGNPGAVALTWNVAQQTALRNVSIVAGDAAVGLDVGAGSDYIHWNSGVPYNLGGGGIVEDVSIVGGRQPMRVAAAQFLIRRVAITCTQAGDQVQAGLTLWQLAWSLVFMNMRINSCGRAVAYVNGPLVGTVQLLDSVVSNVLSGVAIDDGRTGTGLYIQNLAADSSVDWFVDGLVPGPAHGGMSVLPAWSQGPTYVNGTTVTNVPLPSQADAERQQVPLACFNESGAAVLCGGSVESPGTGVPYVPFPLIRDGDSTGGIFNAADAGAVGDGTTDNTVALQKALNSSLSVFLPFGIYLISDTLHLQPGQRLIGEGLSVILLAPNSTGFGPAGTNYKPVLATPADATASVQLADISLWNNYCGNQGATMLLWAGAPNSTMHDVNMLVADTVGAKAVLLGGGYASNTWWPARMSYVPGPTPSRRHVDVIAQQQPAWAAIPTATRERAPVADPGCMYTSIGSIVATTGPLFFVGVNFEHSVSQEVVLLPGATNYMLVGFQTEESPIAILANSTKNLVVYGALNAFWNASQHSISQLLLIRPDSKGFDLSYRIYGSSLPISFSQQAQLVDVRVNGSVRYAIPLPPGGAYGAATAILNASPT